MRNINDKNLEIDSLSNKSSEKKKNSKDKPKNKKNLFFQRCFAVLIIVGIMGGAAAYPYLTGMKVVTKDETTTEAQKEIDNVQVTIDEINDKFITPENSNTVLVPPGPVYGTYNDYLGIDVPGLEVTNEFSLTVTELTENAYWFKNDGYARNFINSLLKNDSIKETQEKDYYYALFSVGKYASTSRYIIQKGSIIFEIYALDGNPSKGLQEQFIDTGEKLSGFRWEGDLLS